MAYRVVFGEFWTDPKIRSLKPTERLLFLYLITNPHSHYSGIYYLANPTISRETGLTLKEVEGGLDTLSMGYLCKNDATFEVVWVVKMAKHQVRGSTQIIGIANHLKTLHNCPLIKDFLVFYSDLGVPYEYPQDGVSMGYTGAIPKEKEKEKEKETESQVKDDPTPTSPKNEEEIVRGKPVRVPYAKLASLWNEICRPVGYPGIESMPEGRKKTVRGAWLKNKDLEWWRKLFEAARDRPHCQRFLTFDSLFRRGGTTAAKLTEGAYDRDYNHTKKGSTQHMTQKDGIEAYKGGRTADEMLAEMDKQEAEHGKAERDRIEGN